ncbi:MAG: response regulator transcription factor [Vicinamibacterales bacterium]
MNPGSLTASPADILIVEDDARLAALLEEFFNTNGFVVNLEGRGDRAVERIARERPTLVILDVMLPGKSGFDVCRDVRATYSGGILMLTAGKAEVDHAVGLELGADDYVIKPVEPRILLARVRSLIRRLDGSLAQAPTPPEVSVGSLTVRRGSREVTVAGTPVEVTALEFDVLSILARQAGEVVSREDLYQQVRGTTWDGVDRGMDVHISRLRQKLEAAGLDAATLKSVRGLGYLLVKR